MLRLATGVESGISPLHICPRWIQVSNLEIVVYRHALAGYRNQIWNQITHKYALARYRCRIYNQITHRYALARYRYRIWNLFVYRYALARYRYRIWNFKRLLTDVPWLDTGIESGISRQQICPGWIQESNLQTLQICLG